MPRASGARGAPGCVRPYLQDDQLRASPKPAAKQTDASTFHGRTHRPPPTRTVVTGPTRIDGDCHASTNYWLLAARWLASWWARRWLPRAAARAPDASTAGLVGCCVVVLSTTMTPPNPAPLAPTRSPVTARLSSESSGERVDGVESGRFVAPRPRTPVWRRGHRTSQPTIVVHRRHPNTRETRNVIARTRRNAAMDGSKDPKPRSLASVRYLRKMPIGRPAHDTASAVATIRTTARES